MRMGYVDVCVSAVPAANREAYEAHSAKCAEFFKEIGVARIVECWEDDVPDGELTDFRKAVKAEEGEVVVVSWREYPSKEARDAASARMMEDPRMDELLKRAPYDGKRMFFGGFAPLLDVRGR